MLTQGELAHRVVKRMYNLTNKKDHMKQIAKKVNCQNVFRAEDDEVPDAILNAPISDHHSMSSSRNHCHNLFDFVKKHEEDPAVKVCVQNERGISLNFMQKFVPKLQDHLLGQLLHRNFDGDTHELFMAED
jgi:hypothetical protein